MAKKIVKRRKIKLISIFIFILITIFIYFLIKFSLEFKIQNIYVHNTKYLNDDKEKIDIIIEELTTSYIYEDNLSSILNENVKLTDKELTDDLLILDFNDALLENGELKEEVVYLLSYSVFANYDINTVSFRVNGKELKNVIKSDLI